MGTRVTIQDWDEIVRALNDHVFDAEYFLDRETGEVLFFTSDAQRAVTTDDDEPISIEWLRTEIEEYKRVLDEGAKYLDLVAAPNAWERMSGFIATVSDRDVARRLGSVIHGRGAFRRFRNELREADLEDQWYAYEYRHQLADAVAYLRYHGIEPTNVPPAAAEAVAEAHPHRQRIETALADALGVIEQTLSAYRNGDAVEQDVSTMAIKLARQLETLSIELEG